jgi:hypothetical protein
MFGVRTSVGLVNCFDPVGIDEISGVRIGAKNFNNVRYLKVNAIETALSDSDGFYTLWKARDTQGNVWILKIYIVFEDTTYMLKGTDLQ